LGCIRLKCSLYVLYERTVAGQCHAHSATPAWLVVPECDAGPGRSGAAARRAVAAADERYRREADDQPARPGKIKSECVEAAALDLGLGRDLLLRAMRWIAALQGRFTAEARAATKIAIEPPERPSSPLDKDVDELARMIRAAGGPKPVQYRGVRRDDCTDGKPEAEVVAQICADLAVVATMLDDDEARQQIAAIAAAARAMLGEPEAALLPLPDLPPELPPVLLGRAPGAAPAPMSGVVPSAPSFDSG
jgi:hypothetical protein